MNKNHWYDGRFYDAFIAPNQDPAFAHVMEIVNEGSTVLDVGCGTGRLAFRLAGKCSRVDGLDPSSRNIDIARAKLESLAGGQLQFHHADAVEFVSNRAGKYDYAVISYVIHEIESGDRAEILGILSAAARRIILVDYAVPQPAGVRRAFDDLVELAAGWNHYRNFRSFVEEGGLSGLVKRAGLSFVGKPVKVASSGEIIVVTSDNCDSLSCES